MKNQVLSVEQIQELINMGIDVSTASMCWGKWNSVKEYKLFAESKASRESFIQDLIEHDCADDAQEYAHDTIPTFTLQDILEILPESIPNPNYPNDLLELMIGKNWIAYRDNIGGICEDFMGFCEDSLLEATFNMLKWCKQNGYL